MKNKYLFQEYNDIKKNIRLIAIKIKNVKKCFNSKLAQTTNMEYILNMLRKLMNLNLINVSTKNISNLRKNFVS